MIKISNFILNTLIVLFFSSCNQAPHLKEADRIIDKFSKEMKKDGFILIGSGGAMMDNIKEFHLAYQKKNDFDVSQARIVLIAQATKLLELINNDIKIRPHLNNYPFSLKNIHLEIFFKQNNGNFSLAPNIATAYIHTGINKVIFTIDVPSKNSLERVHEETFEEALEIYNQTKNLNINNQHCDIKP